MYSVGSDFTILEWDSAHFGFRIGRVNAKVFSDLQARNLRIWAELGGVDCVYLLLSATDRQSCVAAENAGFSLTDIRLTYGRMLSEASDLPSMERVRAFIPHDAEKLRSIASKSHRASRFYFDSRFPEKRCDELYREWIDKSCRGWAQAVYVAERGSEVSGYVTCHYPGEKIGSIGLIAVEEESRGAGLGLQLVTAACNFLRRSGAQRVEVATQGRNLESQRLYQRSGFLTESVELWYHKWFT